MIVTIFKAPLEINLNGELQSIYMHMQNNTIQEMCEIEVI